MSDDEDVRELSSKFDEEMLRTIEKESEQTKRQATFCAHETIVMPYRRRDNIDELHTSKTSCSARTKRGRMKC